MKILFIGDYSGYHSTLARELRRKGHECVVVSDGSVVMDTQRDIDLSRKPGIINSVKYLINSNTIISRLKGFDVVQIINPGFLHLRPGKLKFFFEKLKKQNGLIGLSLAGSDTFNVKSFIEKDYFRYTEFKIGDKLSQYVKEDKGVIEKWTSDVMYDYTRYIYDNVDCAISALYEYHITAKDYIKDKPLVYGGIPIDTTALAYKEFKLTNDGKINILAAIKSDMTSFKGTDRLLKAANEVKELYSDRVNVIVAKDLPLADYLERLEGAHVVLDQLYSYTPATNALQSMAKGKIAVSGAEPEYYEFINEPLFRPIVNVVPDDKKIVDTLVELIKTSDDKLAEKSKEGRIFVEKHNSAEVVASRFIEAWEKAKK